MDYFDLDGFGKVSTVFYGCEVLGGVDWGKINHLSLEKAINISLEMGLNSFDTADVYGLGLSEKRLSRILGSKRHDMFLSTKGGIDWKKEKNKRAKTFFNSKPDYIESAVEASLKRLKIESIPLYYIHWPDPKHKISSTFDKLQNLKNQGKIRFIGCSNFSASQMKEALRHAQIDFCQIPTNILVGKPSSEILAISKKNNINIVAYNVLASGLLTGKFTNKSTFPENDRRSRMDDFKGEKFIMNLKKIKKIKSRAKDSKLSLSKYCIQWVLKQKEINFAIVGFKNSKQVLQNLSS